jgi:hypothetical protein
VVSAVTGGASASAGASAGAEVSMVQSRRATGPAARDARAGAGSNVYCGTQAFTASGPSPCPPRPTYPGRCSCSCWP